MDYDYLEKEVEKKRDVRQLIRDEISKASDAEKKSKFRGLLVKNIKGLKQNASKTVYHLGYDSVSEGLEPVYFWVLDFLKDNNPAGLAMDEVIKYKDEYDASVASGYMGEMGQRASVMQDRAMKIMATINTVVRSIINLIYDLREFSIRLAHYDNIHSGSLPTKSAARLALKQIWMDQVDIKKSRGSINALSQQLEFVTLRDAFLAVDSVEKVDRIDLNDRVKRIVKARLQEFSEWEKNSETELRKRYNIERSYLKSQVASLKHYTAWVKPYLIAAKKLSATPFAGGNSPNLVNTFSNLEMHLNLFGKKKGGEFNGKKVYACIDVEIVFRTVPRSYQGQYGSHYVHSGRMDLFFRSYALTEEEIKEIYELKEQEDLDLIEDMTNVSMKEIQEDIETYLKDEDDSKLEKLKGKFKIEELKRRINRATTQKEKDELKRQLDEEIRFMKQQGVGMFVSSFGNIFKGFNQAIEPARHIFSLLSFKQVMPNNEKFVKKEVLATAEGLCYVLYDIFKKAHGMVTW